MPLTAHFFWIGAAPMAHAGLPLFKEAFELHIYVELATLVAANQLKGTSS